MTQELLGCKDLAEKLRRSLRYVHYMRQRGFKMPGGRATLAAALEWLDKNPAPCREKARVQ